MGQECREKLKKEFDCGQGTKTEMNIGTEVLIVKCTPPPHKHGQSYKQTDMLRVDTEEDEEGSFMYL